MDRETHEAIARITASFDSFSEDCRLRFVGLIGDLRELRRERRGTLSEIERQNALLEELGRVMRNE